VTVPLREHPGLVGHLGRARDLGFLGPGPVEDHIDHAEVFVRALEPVQGTVVDLGSGGGVPGLVIALARPELHLVLVDARAKRCRFLEGAVAELALDAEVVEGRAEVLGHSSLRGTADAVVARSFGVPAATAECAAPLLRLGGWLVVSEPPPPVPADRWPAGPLRELGLVPRGRIGDSPSVQRLELQSACPAGYPRRDGLPAKRPLF
jgi:16S rRNA (guanine527-N7)-methyltransferase